MNTTQVKSLMIPLSAYPTVSENATLGEAVATLRAAQAGLDRNKHPHRAVLIFDKHQNLVGKVNFLSALRGLEPKYEEMIEADAPLGEAVHQLVIGHHQSLLVTAEKRIVGVLRLTDVFEAVADVVTACSLAPK